MPSKLKFCRKELRMGDYLKIGVITFVAYELPELVRLIDAAIRKEHLTWGAGHVVVSRKDPSCKHVDSQFHRTLFAGITWRDSVTDVLKDTQCLLVVGKAKHRKEYEELSKKVHGLRRRKFIELD